MLGSHPSRLMWIRAWLYLRTTGSILDSVSNGSPVWWDATLIPALLSPSDGNPIVLTTVSDRTAPSSITSALGASGILAIYATVVLSIANYARDSFSVSTERKSVVLTMTTSCLSGCVFLCRYTI